MLTLQLKHKGCYMRMYGLTTPDRILVRCEQKLKGQSEKLRNSMCFTAYTKLEIYQEAVILFHKNFEDYYEDDKQYLRFLFIATKNRIRNLLKTFNKYESRYKGKLYTPSMNDGNEDNYIEAMNNVAQVEKPRDFEVDDLERHFDPESFKVLKKVIMGDVTLKQLAVQMNEEPEAFESRIKKTILEVL